MILRGMIEVDQRPVGLWYPTTQARPFPSEHVTGAHVLVLASEPAHLLRQALARQLVASGVTSVVVWAPDARCWEEEIDRYDEAVAEARGGRAHDTDLVVTAAVQGEPLEEAIELYVSMFVFGEMERGAVLQMGLSPSPPDLVRMFRGARMWGARTHSA